MEGPRLRLAFGALRCFTVADLRRALACFPLPLERRVMASPKARGTPTKVTIVRLQQGFATREIALGGKAATFEGQVRQGESLAVLAMLPNIYMNQNLDIGTLTQGRQHRHTPSSWQP